MRRDELREKLKRDIISRYDNPRFWDPNIAKKWLREAASLSREDINTAKAILGEEVTEALLKERQKAREMLSHNVWLAEVARSGKIIGVAIVSGKKIVGKTSSPAEFEKLRKMAADLSSMDGQDLLVLTCQLPGHLKNQDWAKAVNEVIQKTNQSQ